MNLVEGVRLGALEIRTYKLRSFLTLSGIAIGITSVMAMTGIMQAFQRGMDQGLERMGRGRLFVFPKEANGNKGQSAGLVYEDALAIRANFPELPTVFPEVETETNVFYEEFGAKAHVIGITPQWSNLDWNYDLRGRFLSDDDVLESANVCVLIRKRKESGGDWWRQRDPLDPLLKRHDPLGQYIRIHNAAFRVVGILFERPKPHMMNSEWGDKNILVPITAFQKRIDFKSKRIAAIHVDTGDMRTSFTVAKRIFGLLQRRHRGVVDFQVGNMADMMGAALKWVTTLRVVMLAVAGIALFAGGVGIMNITLASIHARIKEIGIRKSVGARDRDIRAQFLLEAVSLSASGGIVGVIAGCGICWAVKALADMAVIPSAASVATAMGVSMVIGVLFAWVPARAAARMDPIVALRYE